jgi:hypothetical protein
VLLQRGRESSCAEFPVKGAMTNGIVSRPEHKISYLPSINAREKGVCQASESTHTACDNGRYRMF